jgi:hypothetical protein
MNGEREKKMTNETRNLCWNSNSAHLFCFISLIVVSLQTGSSSPLPSSFPRVHHLCATYDHFRSLRLCSSELSRQVQKKCLKKRKEKHKSSFVYTRHICHRLPVSETWIHNKDVLLTNVVPTNKMEASSSSYRPIFRQRHVQKDRSMQYNRNLMQLGHGIRFYRIFIRILRAFIKRV